MSLAESLIASSSRPLGLKMRADLSARRQTYQGRSYWVVKEPIGLKYFRFQDEEFAVLNMMKDVVSLEDIKDRFEDEFAPHKITYQDLQQFIGTLHRSGLVISDAPGQGPQLKRRRDERERKELMGKFSNILAVRWKGIDPERLLRFLYPFTRWMFGTAAITFFAMLGIAALLLIGVQFDVFRSRLPEFNAFFGPSNWLMLMTVLCVTKVIHEFGHGLLCHHYGGECHEMGFMLLVLTPCLYCNVSDSWMLPSKWQRAFIGAGGIYFELVMATIATFVWWFSEPGLLNHLALRVMFICSISTVLFNGNPLLRFDGYYILADLIEIPNLRQKATKILQNKAGEVCMGLEMPEDPFLPQSNQFMFGLYTVAAVAYRWFVFASIMFFLNSVFEPYGLKVIGQCIALAGLYGLLVKPVWDLGKFLHVPGRMDQVKWHRVYISAAVVAAVIVGILCLPVPKNVNCSFELQPRDVRTVYVETPGQLTNVAAKPGQTVQEGQPLFSLENDDLKLQKMQVENEIKRLEEKLELAQRNRRLDHFKDQIPELESTLRTQREIRAQKQREYDKLSSIKSPIGGVVFAAPLRPDKPPMDGQLARWSGAPTDPRNLGIYLDTKEILCQIGEAGKFDAILNVDQTDINYVEIGDEVEMVLDAVTFRSFKGAIKEIAPEEMQYVPSSLGNQGGGSLATRMDAEGNERPASATYNAIVQLDEESLAFKNGFRGSARIKAGTQTLFARLKTYLMRTFHFEM